MSPGQWVALALVVICASWLAGEFVRIALWTPPRRTKAEIDADVEELLKADSGPLMQPRVRAGEANE